VNKVIREIELDKLIISPHHARKDLGDLTEFIESIKEVGVLQPPRVRPVGEKYEVYVGSRRVPAAQQAGHTTITAIVDEVTDAQAKLISLIENLQRQDISVVERVEAYKELEALEPAYNKRAALAKAVGVTPQKIGQELQAYEIALVLQPHGIRVESHFHRKSPERQRGEVLPEYHAVLLHQASSWLRVKDVIPDELFVTLQVEWARRIAPHSQEKAEEIIAHLKSTVDFADKLVSGQDEAPIIPPQQDTANPQEVTNGYQDEVTVESDGGSVTCSYCKEEFTLIHVQDGMHQLLPQEVRPKDQPALPGLFP
jgi:ParB/RepB/Spo0J family partition protein